MVVGIGIINRSRMIRHYHRVGLVRGFIREIVVVRLLALVQVVNIDVLYCRRNWREVVTLATSLASRFSVLINSLLVLVEVNLEIG